MSSSLSRKLKRQAKHQQPTSKKYENLVRFASEQTINRVLAVAVDILWNNFGGLQPKGTRLEFFATEFRKRLERIDEGFTPQQLKALEELNRQSGVWLHD